MTRPFLKTSWVRLQAARRWTRERGGGAYASAIRFAGFGLIGWEATIDKFAHPGVFTAAAGMVMFKNVVNRKDE